MELKSLPYLEASIEDFHEAMSKSKDITSKNKRHSVILFEECIEFLFYQKLALLEIDIHKSGQHTIGLDKAIELIKNQGINLLFLDSIRKVQKLRGDAKHHAQVPADKEYVSLLEKLRIFYSAFVFENFWEDLCGNIFDIRLIPYNEVLYIHSEYLKSHKIESAGQQIVSACIHKMKVLLNDKSVLKTWRIKEIKNLASILESLTEKIIDKPISPNIKEPVHQRISNLKRSAKDGDWGSLYDEAKKIYGLIDEILPSDFDLKTAIKITDNLVIPKGFSFGRSMSWCKYQTNDTKLFGKIQQDIAELLKESPEIVSKFEDPFYEYEEDNYWKWWEFAVFDGYRWHSLHLDDGYIILPESGDWGDPTISKKRESVAQAILDGLLKAKKPK